MIVSLEEQQLGKTRTTADSSFKHQVTTTTTATAIATTATATTVNTVPRLLVKLLEKSVIIHRDKYGFGLRIRGEAPAFVEHVHVGGAAWRAGVREQDTIARINGLPICDLDHRSIVMMFKSCQHIVALTLLSPIDGIQSDSITIKQQAKWAPTQSRHILEQHYQQQMTTLSDKDGQIHRDSFQQNKSALVDREPESPKAKMEQLGTRRDMPLRDNTNILTEKTNLASCQLSTVPDNRISTESNCNTILTGGPQTTSNKKRHKTVNKRLEILREFLETEKAHTERLRCLDELFYRPIKSGSLMNSDQLRAVFSCHKRLYKLHRQIYRILLSATTATSGTNLGAVTCCGDSPDQAQSQWRQSDAIQSTKLDAQAAGSETVASFGPMSLTSGAHDTLDLAHPLIGSALMEIFDQESDIRRQLERAACSFCSAQATNVELLNELTKRDSKLGDFLAQVTSQRIVLGRLGLKDLLASCFQRLTKYPLLLENLLKETPSEAPPEMFDSQDNYGQEFSATMDRDLMAACQQERRSQSVRGLALGTSGGPASGCVRGPHDSSGPLEGCNEHSSNQQASILQQQEFIYRARRRDSRRRMLAVSLAEERDSIERSLQSSRQILVKVNESIRVALGRQRFREIWRKTDKYPGVLPPALDTSRQQVIHDGALTLRLSKRSYEVHMLLLSEYIIILTREGQREDKFKLKYFTPEGKSASTFVAAIGPALHQAQSSAAGLGVHTNCPTGNSATATATPNTVSGGPNATGSAANEGGQSTNWHHQASGSSNQSAGSGTSFNSILMLGSGASAGGLVNNLLLAGSGGGGGSAAGAASGGSPSGASVTNAIYSPIFLIDEHLTTRDAATDENGFYLLCKRRDDCRIYEFASRSPADRLKWRELIQWTIERQINRSQRRASCASTLTRSSIASSLDSAGTLVLPTTNEDEPQTKELVGAKLARPRTGSGPLGGGESSSIIERLSSGLALGPAGRRQNWKHMHSSGAQVATKCSAPNGDGPRGTTIGGQQEPQVGSNSMVGKNNNAADESGSSASSGQHGASLGVASGSCKSQPDAKHNAPSHPRDKQATAAQSSPSSGEPTKIVGTISYVTDDEIVMPFKMESSRVFVNQAIQVNILEGTSSNNSRAQTSKTDQVNAAKTNDTR